MKNGFGFNPDDEKKRPEWRNYLDIIPLQQWNEFSLAVTSWHSTHPQGYAIQFVHNYGVRHILVDLESTTTKRGAEIFLQCRSNDLHLMAEYTIRHNILGIIVCDSLSQSQNRDSEIPPNFLTDILADALSHSTCE